MAVVASRGVCGRGGCRMGGVMRWVVHRTLPRMLLCPNRRRSVLLVIVWMVTRWVMACVLEVCAGWRVIEFAYVSGERVKIKDRTTKLCNLQKSQTTQH